MGDEWKSSDLSFKISLIPVHEPVMKSINARIPSMPNKNVSPFSGKTCIPESEEVLEATAGVVVVFKGTMCVTRKSHLGLDGHALSILLLGKIKRPYCV